MSSETVSAATPNNRTRIGQIGWIESCINLSLSVISVTSIQSVFHAFAFIKINVSVTSTQSVFHVVAFINAK